MSAGKSMEDVLRDIHLLISKCPKIKGDPDRIVISKQELFNELEKISQCMYDMLDEYSLSKQKKEEAQYQINKKYDETIAKATSTAEDVYSASVLYTDEAISRLVHILDKNKKDMDNLYHEISREIENEKDKIRANQKELQETLFELQDSNLYLNLIQERRKELEVAKEEAERIKLGKTMIMPAVRKTDVKVNKAYFEQMGLNDDGTKKEEPLKLSSAPQVKVNTESNYFKWKQQQADSEDSDK